MEELNNVVSMENVETATEVATEASKGIFDALKEVKLDGALGIGVGVAAGIIGVELIVNAPKLFKGVKNLGKKIFKKPEPAEEVAKEEVNKSGDYTEK